MSHDLLPDDLWVARLKARADEVTPDVDTDTGTVVRRGRRRRSVRRAATVVGGTAAVAAVLALGAASALRLVTHEVPPAEQPADHAVVIDTSDGTITLPWDRYFLTETEQAEVVHASALGHACVRRRTRGTTSPTACPPPSVEPVDGAQPGG